MLNRITIFIGRKSDNEESGVRPELQTTTVIADNQVRATEEFRKAPVRKKQKPGDLPMKN